MTLAPDASITPYITIRQARISDLDTVRDLIVAAGLSAERGASTATLDGCTYWIADLNGTPAGCIGLEHGEGVSLLRSASVLPASRRRGLGRALAMSALTYASLRGDKALYLFSSGAGPFWQQFGFVPVDTAEISAALPNAPQVVSGERRGWIEREQAWKRVIGA